MVVKMKFEKPTNFNFQRKKNVHNVINQEKLQSNFEIDWLDNSWINEATKKPVQYFFSFLEKYSEKKE